LERKDSQNIPKNASLSTNSSSAAGSKRLASTVSFVAFRSWRGGMGYGALIGFASDCQVASPFCTKIGEFEYKFNNSFHRSSLPSKENIFFYNCFIFQISNDLHSSPFRFGLVSFEFAC
jgi:hypothetical protein